MALSKAALWTAESLNEYAELADSGTPVPNHTPSSAAWWFERLARETAAAWRAPDVAALLGPAAKRRLARLGIEVG